MRIYKLVLFAALSVLPIGLAKAETLLTVETSALGSSPFHTVAALAEVARHNDIANFQIASGQTLTNSLENLVMRRVDVASVPFSLTFLLSRGAGPYSNIGKEKGAKLADDVRLLYTYGLGTYALYAYDSNGLDGYNSIKGKTVLNGPARGAALNASRRLISMATGHEDGVDYTGLQMDWGRMPKAIAGNNADMMMLPLYLPGARLTQGIAAGDISIWSIPKEKWESETFQRYMKSPGHNPLMVKISEITQVEGITFKSEDDYFRSMLSVGGEMVHRDMDFDLAKDLTAAMIKRMPELNTNNTYLRFSNMLTTDPNVTGTCSVHNVKYHPGAIAAWEEAGFDIPECARP